MVFDDLLFDANGPLRVDPDVLASLLQQADFLLLADAKALKQEAGFSPGASFTDIDDLLSVNSRAAVLASQAAIPHLRDGARIITIGSCLAERVPYPNLTVYSMSKSALLAFTRGLARELGPRNITVNLIQPGPIDTDQNPADGDWAEANTRLTALGRYGNPADIAAAVTFLASPAAQFMTGSVMTVDAGFNA